jgi:hypothetical protein
MVQQNDVEEASSTAGGGAAEKEEAEEDEKGDAEVGVVKTAKKKKRRKPRKKTQKKEQKQHSTGVCAESPGRLQIMGSMAARPTAESGGGGGAPAAATTAGLVGAAVGAVRTDASDSSRTAVANETGGGEGKGKSGARVLVKAHYTFGGAGAGNLPFAEGAIFEVSAAEFEAHTVDGRWVTGWNKGREGTFPGNYVAKAGYVMERNFEAAAAAAAAAASETRAAGVSAGGGLEALASALSSRIPVGTEVGPGGVS